MTDSDVPVLALSAEHIVRLTGLTMRQLAYWDRIGFFKPEYAFDNRKSPQSRIYSFTDAVGLRTISVLMNKHNVSHYHLQKVAQKLSAYSPRPWSELKLWVLKGQVYFEEPETGATRDVLGGQYALLGIIEVIQEVKRGIEDLKVRQKDQIGRFERHRYVSHNKLVVAGTRIPVETVLEFLDAGYTVEEIIREFPALKAEDIQAVATHGKAALAA